MNVKLFFSTLLTHLLVTLTFGQIKTVDAQGKPIPYVHVSASNAKFQSLTGLNGVFDTVGIRFVKPDDYLVFQHIGYKPYKVVYREIQLGGEVVLQENTYDLPVLTVTLPKGNYFKRIYACYRTLQLNDGIIKYYVDGKGSYISKSNKESYSRYVTQSRSFENELLIKEDKERSVSVQYVATPPMLASKLLPEVFSEKNGLVFNRVSDEFIEILTSSGDKVGQIRIDSTFIVYQIQDVFGWSNRTQFETEVKKVEAFTEMVFHNVKGSDPTKIDDFDYLVYQKRFNVFDVKHNKDKAVKRVTQVYELFVEEHEQLAKFKKSDIQTVPWKPSNYTTNFWESCDCPIYTMPSESTNSFTKIN